MKIYIPYYENRSWHTATLNSFAYQNKNYGNANVYKLEVESIEWKNRK